jgi:hypothetical protein
LVDDPDDGRRPDDLDVLDDCPPRADPDDCPPRAGPDDCLPPDVPVALAWLPAASALGQPAAWPAWPDARVAWPDARVAWMVWPCALDERPPWASWVSLVAATSAHAFWCSDAHGGSVWPVV